MIPGSWDELRYPIHHFFPHICAGLHPWMSRNFYNPQCDTCLLVAIFLDDVDPGPNMFGHIWYSVLWIWRFPVLIDDFAFVVALQHVQDLYAWHVDRKLYAAWIHMMRCSFYDTSIFHWDYLTNFRVSCRLFLGSLFVSALHQLNCHYHYLYSWHSHPNNNCQHPFCSVCK